VPPAGSSCSGSSASPSPPLVAIAATPRATGLLMRAREWAGGVPAFGGIVLMALGILSIVVAWGQVLPR